MADIETTFTGRLAAIRKEEPSPYHVPRMLYHYTTLDGLLGILEQASLRATAARFLNDRSELTYAAEVVAESLDAALSVARSDEVRGLLNDAHTFANPLEGPLGQQVYLASFCEEDDLLSQWRGYGKSQACYSLGLDVRNLMEFGDFPPFAKIYKVVYEKAEQRSIIVDVVAAWSEGVDELLEAARFAVGDVLDVARIALRDALVEYHVSFKDPSFREEKEWRLVVFVNQFERELLRYVLRRRPEVQMSYDVPIEYRRGDWGMVPYVTIPLKGVNTGPHASKLPLRTITQGPSPDTGKWRSSLERFLISKGYDNLRSIRSTEVPLTV